MYKQIYNNVFSVANVPIGVIFGSRRVRASGTYREPMENVRMLFVCPLKLKQRAFVLGFQLPNDFSMGFTCTHVCNPHTDKHVSENAKQ